MQLQPEIANALMAHRGETALAVGEQRRTSIILKSEFEYNRYKSCIVVVTPMIGLYDTGPVFRIHFQFVNQFTSRPIYAGETFLNPVSSYDAPLIQNLTSQAHFDFHFFNLDLGYIGSKRIRWNPQTAQDIRGMIQQCKVHADSIPANERDFETARGAMIAEVGSV